MREIIERRIREAGLDDWSDLLLRYAAPAIGLEPTADAIPKLGESKLGGDADVPPGFDWPRYRERPLSFVMQVDLASVRTFLADSPLPGSGLLAFFYEGSDWGYSPEHRGSARVFHFAKGSSLERTAPPPGPERRRLLGLTRKRKNARRFRECSVLAKPVITLKDLRRRDLRSMSDEQFDALIELEKDLGAAHHLLGHPQPVQQDEMALECQLVDHGFNCGRRWPTKDPRYPEIAAGAEAWRLLLQVESETRLSNVKWGDVGTVYYWIRDEDLRCGSFEGSWLICQST